MLFFPYQLVLLFASFIDGSDIVQQWVQLHLGALPSGSLVYLEWKTQGQPPGQSPVSGTHLKLFVEG
jgi:hypothetical protein